MAMSQSSTVVGVFDDRQRAERAVEELRRMGFRDDQIGFATRDESGAGETSGGAHTGEGAATGAVVGGIIGAAAALLIPGVGPVVAGGVLASVLGGAAVGAAAGGILGALVGMGVPEEEARYYEGEFQSGRTIVTVQANGRADEARMVLQRHGGYDAQGRTEGRTEARTEGRPTPPSNVAARTTEGDQTVQLREEELRVRKEREQAGEVGIKKEVVSEQRTMEVPVTHEEVVVERQAVDRRPADSPISEEATMRIPVTEEHVTVEKRPVVTEEIHVGKREVQETEQVSGTVRREEAHIVRDGDVQTQSASTGSAVGWDAAMPQMRNRWQTRYGNTGGRWEESEPHYRYGWQMANDTRYRGRSWNEVEPEFRRDWEARNPNTPWDRAKDYVRDAWDHVTGDNRR